MKKIIIVFSVILLITTFIGIKVFSNSYNIGACSGKESYDLYTCEVKNFCKKQEYGLNNTKIVNLSKDYTKDLGFLEAKKVYSDNQNAIYKCGVLESQRKVFDELIKKLVNTTDKTGILKSTILPQIRHKLKLVNQLKSKNKCNKVEKNIIKKIILDESTFELCKYKYFLSYLYSEKKDNFSNDILENKNSISTLKAKQKIQDLENNLNNEIKRAIRTYSIAYKTYSQYDDYLKSHILLDLIKQDYINYRDSLYQMLHPINQTTYKIINAQNP